MQSPKRKAAELTAAELDEKAKIEKPDVDRARDAWKRHAPPRFRNLLDAKRKRR